MRAEENSQRPTNTNCLIMGVLNVTPDSFSDGGAFLDPDRALNHIETLINAGADIIDIGAESSRPGARLVSLDEERQRLFPILERLAERRVDVALSIDTNKPEIMLDLSQYGVKYINNIKGLPPFECMQALASKGHDYIAMHMHGTPETMQRYPLTGKSARTLFEAFCHETQARLQEAGFSPARIWLDPGIGFGKTDAANLDLLRYCMEHSGQFQFAVGLSRKSMLGRLFGIENPLDRDDASKGLELGLIMAGVQMIRTHEVERLVQMRQVLMSQD